jgi:amino acid permease
MFFPKEWTDLRRTFLVVVILIALTLILNTASVIGAKTARDFVSMYICFAVIAAAWYVVYQIWRLLKRS